MALSVVDWWRLVAQQPTFTFTFSHQHFYVQAPQRNPDHVSTQITFHKSSHKATQIAAMTRDEDDEENIVSTSFTSAVTAHGQWCFLLTLLRRGVHGQMRAAWWYLTQPAEPSSDMETPILCTQL